MADEWVSYKRASEILGVSTQTIRRWALPRDKGGQGVLTRYQRGSGTGYLLARAEVEKLAIPVKVDE